ncbi:FAS1 domain-containing protein [Hyaloraphidium curvatum]|nr:FAS1 domain-containing protein [Hyaloraphidium curvatum]
MRALILAAFLAAVAPATAQLSSGSGSLSATRTAAQTATIIRPATTTSAAPSFEPLPSPTLWDNILKVTSGEISPGYQFNQFKRLVDANPAMRDLLWGRNFPSRTNMTLFAFTDSGYTNMGRVFGAGYVAYVEGQSADLINYHLLPKRIQPLPEEFLWERTMLGNTGGLSTIAEGQVIQIDATVKPPTQAQWKYVQNGFNAQGRIVDTLPATNGIIYVVDQVVVPPFAPSQVAKTGGDALKGFYDALERSNAAAAVDGLTRATVFAPVTSAWDEIPQIFTELTTAELQDVMNHHVIPNQILFASNITNGVFVQTASGETLDFIVDGDSIRITDEVNDALVGIKDTVTKNGLLHQINKVLLPPKFKKRLLPTIMDTVSRINTAAIGVKNYKLGTLEALLDKIPSYKAMLNGTAGGNGTITLFAPTDRAFFNIAPTDGLVSEDQVPAVPEILAYHVLPSETKAADWTGNDVFRTMLTDKGALGLTSLDGQRLLVARANESGVSPRQAETDWALKPYEWVVLHGANRVASIVDTIECKNGFIHIVDNVLVPPATVTESARSLGYTAFVDALAALGRNATIDGLQRVTVFVPTNEAFAAVADSIGALTPNQLESALAHHIHNGLVYSDVLANASSATIVTADGTDLTLTKLANGTVTVDGATVVNADVLTKNGVMHVVNRVLVPRVLPSASSVATGTATSVPTSTSRPASAGSIKAGWMAAGVAAALSLAAI